MFSLFFALGLFYTRHWAPENKGEVIEQALMPARVLV